MTSQTAAHLAREKIRRRREKISAALAIAYCAGLICGYAWRMAQGF